MPKSRSSNDENRHQYDEELLEGEEPFIAEHRAALANREISKQHAKERRETSRWFIEIIVIVAIALTYTAQSWITNSLIFDQNSAVS